MSTLYVDTLEPNQNTAITAASGKLLPVGHVVQTQHKQCSASDNQTISSSTFTDLSGLSLNITPFSATSKMLVTFSFHVFLGSGTSSNSWVGLAARCLRDSTVVYSDDDGSSTTYGEAFLSNTATDRVMTRSSHIFLDTPSTTSQLTYKIQVSESHDRGNNPSINYYGALANLVVQEIAQ
jgi:hypothetical protein